VTIYGIETLKARRTPDRKIQVSTRKCWESLKFLCTKYTAVNTNREQHSFGTHTNETKLVKPKIYRRYLSDEKPSEEPLGSHGRKKANTSSRQSTQFAKQIVSEPKTSESLPVFCSWSFHPSLQHMKT